MASIKDTAATSALNEDKYINELYDTNLENQNRVLTENYGSDQQILDQEQKAVGETTGSYVDRTQAEGDRAKDLYGDGGLSAGAQAQIRLSQENTQRKNVQQLREAQNDADAEFERQRQLLAREYESAIRQAQMNNDMERAQALYDAAKAEEEQLLQLQKKGAAMMAGRGDNSIYNDIANGVTLERDTTGETWEEVLKNEEALNAIYDAQLESLLAGMRTEYESSASDLEARRGTMEKQTDERLTQSYVEALQGQKNAAEMAGANGQGSGTAARGRLSRDEAMLEELTDIRKAQVDAEGAAGLEALELSRDYGRDKAGARHDIDLERALKLYEAAENEEQRLVENQLLVGKNRAGRNDYSILGRLYGLTKDQVDRLQGTGRYASHTRNLPPDQISDYELTPQDLIWIRNEVNGTTRGY